MAKTASKKKIQYWGTGRRKKAVARVRLIPGGTGAIVINGKSLDELTESLDPERFFRVNRQYLISRGAVQDIDLWFNNRLAINLRIPTGGEGRILVSKLRVNEFKNWFSGY